MMRYYVCTVDPESGKFTFEHFWDDAYKDRDCWEEEKKKMDLTTDIIDGTTWVYLEVPE
jgi:hypothetical protein